MHEDDDVLEVVNETATLTKRDVMTGRVRVTTRTELAEEQLSAALNRTDVEVTRVAINRDIDAAPAIRTEGDVTIIPVIEEILVVEKRLVLREEIHVRQITTTESVTVPTTLRKQHAVIERQAVPDLFSEEETRK